MAHDNFLKRKQTVQEQDEASRKADGAMVLPPRPELQEKRVLDDLLKRLDFTSVRQFQDFVVENALKRGQVDAILYDFSRTKDFDDVRSTVEKNTVLVTNLAAAEQNAPEKKGKKNRNAFAANPTLDNAKGAITEQLGAFMKQKESKVKEKKALEKSIMGKLSNIHIANL